MLKVIKRDGRIKEYDFARICSAVAKAYNDVYLNKDDLADRSDEMINVVMELHSRLEKLVHSSDANTIEVEKLQDMIIETLEKYNKEVSK